MKTHGYKSGYRTKECFLFCLLLFACFHACFNPLRAQDSLKAVSAAFDTLPLIIQPGEIISNNLRVINRKAVPIGISVEVAFPPGWKTLSGRDRIYTVDPGDSIFIPVRIIPLGRIRGNTKYLVNAYVYENDSIPVASSYFYVLREKVNSWEMRTGPNERIYFKNKSNEESFFVQTINTGNEDQELILDFENLRPELLITDTNDNILKKTVRQVKLKPNEDTTFHFKARFVPGMRNQRLVDTETYLPNSYSETRNFSLFVKSAEPSFKSGRNIQKLRKLDFVRLSSQAKVNPYGYSSLPLIAEANISNILGGQPILNLNFRGNTQLENGAALNYFSQYFFSSYQYSDQFLSGSFHYIGYFHDKYHVELGDVGGIGGGTYNSPGRGITGSYSFLPGHRVAAFYTRNPNVLFGKSNRDGYGILYSYTPFFGTVNAGYSGVDNKALRIRSDYFNANASVRLRGSHSVSGGGQFVMHNSTSSRLAYNRNGFMAYTGYTGSFLGENRLRSSLFGSYQSAYYELFNKGDTWIANHSSSYKLTKKWMLQMSNNLNRRNYIPEQSLSPPYRTLAIGNLVNGTFRREKSYIGPGLFYNISRINNMNFHSRGASVNFGKFEYENNQLITTSILAGYSRVLEERPRPNDYFFFQAFTLYRYKVLSASARYSYGYITVYDTTFLKRSNYPQSISLSLNYQYQFRNPHLILHHYSNYSYFNQFQRHNLGYSPELFFFTNSGWRLRLSVGFYLSRSNAQNQRIGDVSLFEESKPITTISTQVQFGVRKEFGIPIPFSKKKFHSADFIAFIDLNGNKKKDAEEISLENIVIKTGDWEVLTNERGKASIKNIPKGSYRISVFSLEELEGFFPGMEEEIMITKDQLNGEAIPVPFVKGIKIYGKVIVDREKIMGEEIFPLDLSGIKVTASNGKEIHSLTNKDGSFSFYVPYGEYKLNMNEHILGEKFKLLENDIELKIDKDTESLFITFYIVEKRRKINKKRF